MRQMEAWCVEVAVRPGLVDAAAAELSQQLASGSVTSIRGFLLPATLTREEVERAASELLADPITDRYVIATPGATCDDLWPDIGATTRVVARRRPGVMDPVARSVQTALADLGIEVEAAGTYRSFLLDRNTSRADLEYAGRLIANDVIEECLIDTLPPGLPLPGGICCETRVEVPLAGLDEDALNEISRNGVLSLNAAEMRCIQEHFASLGRTPTLTELETLAQTWSEHCNHKTLTGRVVYEDGDAEPRIYENLLKETIFTTTQRIDHWMCVSVFVDYAGIVDFDGKDCLAIKVETHNHPSAIEPFGGAGTGIGGVIRDILGTGLGAKPLCNLDVFCVAAPDTPEAEVPAGCLHPARVLDGVVRGVRDYGNPMGIPTVTGAVHFDQDFLGNPLVYAGTVGILPKTHVRKAALPGDRIVVTGGRTGRDGIHGATFSSVQLDEASETVSSGAVQIGDPITEKKVTDALIEARDEGLYHAVTDCGAGGLSSAVGEMGEKIGARVELERVLLKYDGLTPTEIWISEAQERMVFAVPPQHLERFHEICARFEVESSEIGDFTDTKHLELSYAGESIADLEMEFMHNGLPRPTRHARWSPPQLSDPELPWPEDLNRNLLEVLADPCVCSKEWIVRQFDHEVQGQSAAKPLTGSTRRAPGDAAVVAPKPDSPLGFAVATGLNPRYSRIDPASMAEAALDEAIRNVVARGGDPTRCVILDNYCWGNTDDPEQLGALVRATEAVCEAAFYYRTPFVSGKDSLHNEYHTGDKTIAIPGCLLVTALAIVPDVREIPDSAFTAPDRNVYLVGRTHKELGGSVYWKLAGKLGASAPRLGDPAPAIAKLRFLHETIGNGWVAAAHDLSEGGLAVAAAEMAFGGGVGLFLDVANVDYDDDIERDDEVLFSESLGRLLVEPHPEHEDDFVNFLTRLNVPIRQVGRTVTEPVLVADGITGDRVLEITNADLERAWSTPLARGPLAFGTGAST